jgi:hypothetical protein
MRQEEFLRDVLEKMKKESLFFWDEEADFFQGEEIVYSYSQEKQSFICKISDTIVGSYHKVYQLNEEQILTEFKKFPQSEFVRQGFII